MKKNNRKGFTIVELVIVIAVIAILAGVLIPTFSGVVKKAKENAALQEAQNAYKEAYAIALSDDGKIDTDDNAEITAAAGETPAVVGIEVSGFIFKVASVNASTGAVTWEITEPADFDYTVTVTDGKVSVSE